MMVSQGKRKYKQNAFTKYLSAVLYETDGDFNNAYVDYKAVHDLVPGYPVSEGISGAAPSSRESTMILKNGTPNTT